MKFLFILIALPVMTSKCNRNTENDGYLRGKVVRISCASFVVQVLNNDSFGEDNWKDIKSNNMQYDNVFAVSNACKIPAGVKAGTTIRFKASSPKPNDCVYCMMYDAPPSAKYDITDVMIEEGK